MSFKRKEAKHCTHDKLSYTNVTDEINNITYGIDATEMIVAKKR